MKICNTLLTLILLSLVVFVSTGNSAISVDPSIPAVGQIVSVTISNTLPANAFTIEFIVSFGDGSPAETSPAFTTVGPNSHTFTHTYSKAGNYTITGTTRINFRAAGPVTSDETVNISAIYPINELPRGIVGQEYNYDLAPASAPRTNRYRIIRGKLPPYLELQRNGQITGIPAQKGSFNFTIEVISATGLRYTQDLTLLVDPGTLEIEVTPNPVSFTLGGVKSKQATFRVVAPTIKINETIRSNRGVFLAGNKVLGYLNKPLNINLNTDGPYASESVNIPNDVLQAAQNAGTVKISYSRRFTAKNFKPGSGKTHIDMRSPASGELRITKLRIYFEQNNRPIILVERNSRGLRGLIDVHYNGSGTFKGFWKVDERIIERVQKNAFYGNVMTIKTPVVPQLPTFSEGSHRLQFIITEPATAVAAIDFPEAIYNVEAKRAERVDPLTLTTPENWAELGTSDVTFSWTGSRKVSTYYVEFFEAENEEPFFTAFTTKPSYSMPLKLQGMKFTEDKTFSWQVRGFNKAGVLTGESSKRQFTLLPKTTSASGKTFFIANNCDSEHNLIPRVTMEYNLQRAHQTELNSINQILVPAAARPVSYRVCAEVSI